MNAIATTGQDGAPIESGGSVSAASKLSPTERIFVECFVANGGRGDLAAVAAGIEEGKAAVQACRWLCRQRVAAYIHEMCATFAHSQLPVAIRALVEIAGDDQALRKDRIKAATSLLEHGGMAAPKGGVQVNVGVQVNGQEAQRLIGSVWEAKQARLSDIPTAMSDTFTEDMKTLGEAIDVTPTSQAGGDHPQGPAAGTCPLPVPSSEHDPFPSVSPEPVEKRHGDWTDPAATFRAAFDEGDEDV